jgi:hypothetical protein
VKREVVLGKRRRYKAGKYTSTPKSIIVGYETSAFF